MVRFIVLTFAFMGWGFYEMSGGADFEPGQVNAQREAARLERAEQKAALAAVARANTSELELTQVAVRMDAPEAPKAEVAKPGLQVAGLGGAALISPDKAETVAAPETPAAQEVAAVASAPAPAPVAAVAEPAEELDLRRVTGNRVNMRQGPGTNFSVVDKLVRGDEVVVLQDPGNGWVKLRIVDGNRVGWMADFLLASVE